MSLLTALLWGTGLLASPGAESTDEPAFGEQVEVRAELPEATSAPLGTHSTVVDPAESLEAPSNLAGLVTEVPAVMENGQGGQLQVFSIRGVSRQRVTNLISDSKITSERRAGVSLSFVDPWLMRSVEVVRGPATTFHGSGALGGVVQVFPRQFDGWVATAGYRSQGNERFISAGTGDGDRWSIGLAYRQADNAEAADGTEINSHFTQYSAVLDTGWGQGNVRYRLTYIPTYGDDIGKANTDFPERTTNYPRERHHLVKFAAVAESGWLVHAFVHAHDLETEVVDESTRNFVTNETFDFGGRWEQQVELGAPTLRVGIQGFGRRGVDATELEEDLDPVDPEEPILLQTIDDARETELGGYAVVDWRALGADWEAGTRVSWIEQQNGDGPTRDDTEVTAHLGVSRMFGRSWELKGSVGTGLRFPSLSERFFSGTTPRGGVIGNPDLDEENALNLDVTARWVGSRTLVELGLFHNDIDDYIERIEVMPDILTFVNLSSGTIRGVELQGVHRATDGLRLRWGGHAIEGEGDGGIDLADIPPSALWLGADWRRGAWSAAGRLTYRADKDDPGSGENPIPSAALLSASVGYRFSGGLTLVLRGTNLLDEEYFRAADRKAPLAPGRAVGLSLSWQSGS